MKFRITYSDSISNDRIEEINTLDDLFALVRKEKYNLIFTIFDLPGDDITELKEPIIEVYNDYRE